jgi:predicted NACHT family NTPase
MNKNKSKIEKINSLTKEVEEFHPLLRVLFSRLPNITKVEYTHGPNEMGADFVITKKDDTLDDFEYIGIIVKSGVIKQDHSDINRQIEECEVNRTVDGGTRNIFLSEIWVVSNDTITSNAQTKIHNNYKNKNIKFIDGEKVSNLIEKFYHEYWIDASVQIGEYLREVCRKADLISSNSILPNMSSSNLYINQELVIDDLSSLSKKAYETRKFKEKRITIHEALKSNKFIFIDAMMGTGKSTLLARLASHYANSDSFSDTNTIPILLTVKEFVEDWSSDIYILINEVCKRSFADINKIKFIVLLDGFDELKIDNNSRMDLLKSIYDSSLFHGSTSVIITSRSLDDPEIEQKVAKMFTMYKLCQFTIKQVIGLVDNICKNSTIKERLVKDLEKSHLFKVLPKTPFSAILLAKLLNENIQEIPSTMTDLYSKYMELVMGRWDMTK